uniref:EOG090X0HLW n=1 Tax=Evadne anonyx TaxID=141404 RepID=A0A9N6WQP3_9CRUS|nr:EOG090X0HLW [Evadne anonyx]
MKFRFCGDQDCPDWFLTQMGTLSRLSSVKAKLLTQHVARHLIGQEMKVEKTSALLADLKLRGSDAQSLLVSIEFILSSASRFSTSEEHLRAELQQVGLPKEHAAALAKVHQDSTRSIRQKLLSDSSSPNSVEDVNWRLVDDEIELDFQLKGTAKSGAHSFAISAQPAKLQPLLYELEKIQNLISQYGMNGAMKQ